MPTATSALTSSAAVATPACASVTPSEPNTRSTAPPGNARETALRIIGKEEALAELLWVSPGALRRYLGGEARPPDDVFLKAADIVFNHAWGAAASRGEPAERASNIGRIDRNRDTVRSSARIISASARLLEATQAARAEAEALRGFKHRLFDRDYRPEDQHDVLQTGLDAALSATGTDVGDI